MKWVGYVVGALMVLTGIVWILQGLGVLTAVDSFMIGQPEWVVAGAISVIIGAVVLWLVSRRGPSAEEQT